MSQTAEKRAQNKDHNAYFNGLFDAVPVLLEPQQTAWGQRPEDMIVTTVGAGMVISIHDHKLGMGAMGSVLIPNDLLQIFPDIPAARQKELDAALAPIMDVVGHMKRAGAAKKRLFVRLIGGGAMPDDLYDCGTKHRVIIQSYLQQKGLQILNADTGGEYVRRIHFFPHTGKAVRFVLRRDSDFASMKAQEAGA